MTNRVLLGTRGGDSGGVLKKWFMAGEVTATGVNFA